MRGEVVFFCLCIERQYRGCGIGTNFSEILLPFFNTLKLGESIQLIDGTFMAKEQLKMKANEL